jgi:hypothetical protein
MEKRLHDSLASLVTALETWVQFTILQSDSYKPWASSLSSLSLSFPIYQMNIAVKADLEY